MTVPSQPEDQSAISSVKPPHPMGLRERKKAKTMYHVQTIALQLFDKYGFDKVTIEQVAEVAEVSQSTIYRYFSTKEGLVVYDEYDDQMLGLFRHYLDQGLGLKETIAAAVSGISGGYFQIDTDLTRSRMRLWIAIPAVRAAALLMVDQRVEEIAKLMAETGRWPLRQSRVIVSAIAWSAIAALKNWYEAGANENITEYILQAMSEAYEVINSSD